MSPSSPGANGASDNQSAFELDDGTGLRVVRASFAGERKFSWGLFEGYDSLRVLTYSASTNAHCQDVGQLFIRDLRVRVWIRRHAARD